MKSHSFSFTIGDNITAKVCFNEPFKAGDAFFMHCHQHVHHDAGMAMFLDVVAGSPPVSAPALPPMPTAVPAPVITAPVQVPVTPATAPVTVPVPVPVLAPAPIQVPVPTTGSAPILAPLPAPVLAPTDTPSPTICFSGANIVEIKDVGHIPISKISIGDAVRTVNGHFTKVYGFGHFDHDNEAEFIQIYLDDNSSLEISPSHLLFVQTCHDAKEDIVPAIEVVIGNFLSKKQVIDLQRITRRGVYAPLTLSGDLLVNGIRVSNYVKILDDSNMVLWNQHIVGHACFFPQRVFCSYFMDICRSEVYINGYGVIASKVVYVGNFVNEQGWIARILFSMAVTTFVVICVMAHTMMSTFGLWLLIITLVGITIKMKVHRFGSRI